MLIHIYIYIVNIYCHKNTYIYIYIHYTNYPQLELDCWVYHITYTLHTPNQACDPSNITREETPPQRQAHRIRSLTKIAYKRPKRRLFLRQNSPTRWRPSSYNFITTVNYNIIDISSYFNMHVCKLIYTYKYIYNIRYVYVYIQYCIDIVCKCEFNYLYV